MGRQASVRSKNGHWMSEAGGEARYFGRVDCVSRNEALSRLYAALAGDEGHADRGGGVFDSGASPSVTMTRSTSRKEGTISPASRATTTTTTASEPAHAPVAEGGGRETPPPLSTLTVSELRDKYLAWVAKHRALTNFKAKVTHLRRFVDAHGKRDAAKIRGVDLESFLGSLKHSVQHIRKHEVSVRACFRWGVKHAHLPAGFTPFATVEAIRPPAKALLESDLPTQKEVRDLIAHSTPRLADFLAVQYATGARTGELRAAIVRDYQPKTRQVVLAKHKREKTTRGVGVRVLALNDAANAVVARLCQGRHDDAPLFPSPKGRAWGDRSFYEAIERARRKAGV